MHEFMRGFEFFLNYSIPGMAVGLLVAISIVVAWLVLIFGTVKIFYKLWED